GDQRERLAPGDRMPSEAEWQRQRRAIVEAHARARAETVVEFESVAAVLPPPMDFTTADGHRVRISPLDVYRRLPVYEQRAARARVPVAAVGAIVHEGTDHRLSGAAVLDPHGRAHVFLAVNHLPCPVLRAAAWRHELEHVRRGHLAPKPYSPFREAEEREEE